MGGVCATARTEEEKEAQRVSREIDKQLKDFRKDLREEVKILLLGTASSGKSTIAKQMQIIYLNGFKPEECEEWKVLIMVNLITNMKALIDGAQRLGIYIPDDLGEEVGSINKISEEELQDKDFVTATFPNVLDALQTLWSSQAIQTTFKRRSEFPISDSADYFFANMKSYKNMDNYIVTDKDILRVRKQTSGIHEIIFKNDRGQTFRMVDVGGQRTERRKWIHCFEDVTAIIYVASLSEYDQNLEEDESMNRLAESLDLFDKTINSTWFATTPIILFLNKNDLFEEKSKRVDLAPYLQGYDGGLNPENARKAIRKAYSDKNRSPKKARDIYVHVTTATNTENVQTVFNIVANIFLQGALGDAGVGGF